MKLDLNKPLVDLTGTPVTDQGGEPMLYSKVAANALIGRTGSSDPVKDYQMAVQLATDGTVEVFGDDAKMIEDALKGSQQFTSLATGQIIAEIRKQKEAVK